MATQDAPDTTTLTAKCFCGQTHFTIDVPTAKLPLQTYMCHCSICRWTHGIFNVFHATLPSGLQPRFVPPSSLAGSTTGYRFKGAASTRYFCSSCGCHIGDQGVDGDSDWVIAASIFAPPPAGDGDISRFFLVNKHVHTDSAPGGGLYTFLPGLETWNPKSDPTPAAALATAATNTDGGSGEERLRAQCHCGGVSFTVRRPASADHAHPKTKRLISPTDPTRWKGSLDLCDDCRLVSGAHVVPWAFVSRAAIEPPLGEDLVLGSSKVFRSSPGVLRSFCGTCGATVFFSDEAKEDEDGNGAAGTRDRRPTVDIAAGLLRADDGPLAEKWVSWRTDDISFYDSGAKYDQKFAAMLKKGLEEWGSNGHGETGIGPAP